MINIQITDYSVTIAFWLCFTRWAAILFQLPIFDNQAIPRQVKVLGSLVITYAFFPMVQGELLKDIAHVGVDNFWFLTIFNVIVGLVIGYFVKSIMSIYTGAGSIITQEIGFTAIQYFDPSQAQRVGPFEKMIQWTIIIMVLTSGALLPMFKGIVTTFSNIHIYDLSKFATSPEYCLSLFKSIFFSSLLLASPLIFINMLINVVLGIVARTVPQMNIIMVSFVVNIGLGLLVFASASDEFFRVAFRIYTEKLGHWLQFVS